MNDSDTLLSKINAAVAGIVGAESLLEEARTNLVSRS